MNLSKPSTRLSRNKRTATALLLSLCALGASTGAYAQTHSANDDSNIVVKKGKLFIELPERNVSIKLDNKAYFDAVAHMKAFDDDHVSLSDNPVLIPNGLTIPMLYFAVHADIRDKWSLNVELDMGGGKMKYRTIYAGYNFNDETKLLVGNLKVPSSMSANVVMSNLYFQTRPTDVQLMTPRRLGAALYHYAKKYSLAGGVFTIPMDDVGNSDQELMFTARGTYNIIRNAHTTLMVGLNGFHLRANDGKIFSMRAGLESSYAKDRYLINKISDAKYRNTLGGELALSHDRLLATAEYVTTNVVRNEGPSVRFHGANGRLSYMISGQPRTFKQDGVDFASYPNVAKHSATEIGLNANYLNLNDADHKDQYMYTFGLFANHFFNYNFALGLEAKYSQFGKDALGGGAIIVKDDRFAGIRTWQISTRLVVNF